MRQMSRIRCTFVVGVKRTSTDKISSKTQCCAKDLVPEGEEGSELGGSHTPLVFTDTTFWAQPKPMYKSDQVTAYRDVPVYAEQTDVRANRIDARFVDRGSKTVTFLEISCPWVENRKQKEEKTAKYAPLRLELKRQHPGYEICQYNVIIDVFGDTLKKPATG